MELTVDQALQQGIVAHKEGKLPEAEKLYRAILSAQPNHPDANHNLGVLAVGVGKISEALPFFKVALGANPKQEQFWLSYIDTLIKAGQLDDARQMLQQAKASGLNDEKVHQLEEKLKNTVSPSSSPTGNNSNPSKPQLDRLIALYRQGKLQEAFVHGTTLANLFPNDPQIPNILGAMYSGSGQYEEAIASYTQAIKLKSDYADSHNNLANILNGLGQYEEAIASYNKAIELKPDYAEAYNNLGNALNQLGKYEEAVNRYNKAIELKPSFAEAYNNLGITLNQFGRYEEAIDSYTKAIELKPDYAEAYNNLGITLNRIGKYKEAVANYNKAIASKLGYIEAYNNLSNVLRSWETDRFSGFMAQNYLDILNYETIVRPKTISNSVIILLKHHDDIRRAIRCNVQDKLKGLASEFCLRLSELPLFLKIMEVCPIPDLEIEEVLKGLRTILLLRRQKLSTNHDLLPFQSSLALQCFTNEFIYGETTEETVAIEALEASLQQSFLNNEELPSYDLACLASYRPLFNYPWATDLTPPSALGLLFKRQVAEVKQELELKKSIPRLNSIEDDVSLAVQRQYEENPYPRWVNTRLEPMPMNIATVMAKFELEAINNNTPLSETPHILIAGCGTGQHSLSAASMYKGCHITAIDLSLNSLAYALRKTEEFGFTNINYLRADILDLGLLGKQFDIIESSGVLHHMADPIAGWKVLTDCLKPGGLMRIGLYSELARQGVVKARDMIAKNKIASDKESMLKFRRTINKLDDPAINLETSIDFYSTSTVRDLLFHVQEHRFTIPQINEALDDLGLAFIGFEFFDQMDRNSFKIAYPKEGAIYDLDKWHEYEVLNPRLFAGMYQFWAQKL